MIKNKEIEEGAQIIAEDFKLPGGRRKPVARLVKEHLSWFDAAEARGMFVDGILNTLTAAGVTYEDGSSINFATLSNALWRTRNETTVETKASSRKSKARDKSDGRQARLGGWKSPKQKKQIEHSAAVVKPAAKRPNPPSIKTLKGTKGATSRRGDTPRMSVKRGSLKREVAKEVGPASATLRGELRRQATLRQPRSDDE